MSDNLNTPPVTRLEGTSGLYGYQSTSKTSTALNGIYTDQAVYQSGIHGPFNQTLFLGCSIVNFNVNLGWGAENSTLTVSLVNDDAPHWLGMTTTTTLQNFDLSTYANGAQSRTTFNTSESTESTTSPRLFASAPTVAIDGTTPNNVGGTPAQTNKITSTVTNDNKVADFKEPNPTLGPSKELHMDLILQEKQRVVDATANNVLLNSMTVSPKRPDLGKVYYELREDGSYNKKYWLKKDPGFIGEAFDILGCPVAFIFNDFTFAGVITSWKNNGGQGGNKLYTVEIKSFATLLANTQLVIDHYPGTIFTKFNNNPLAFNSVGGFGMPSNDIGNRYAKKDSTAATECADSEYPANTGRYVGNIKQGNLPNIFNIYGYLETTLGFGKSNINEEGTNIADILSAMKDLINYTDDTTRNPQYMDLRFSPYGRIVGRAPAVTKVSGTTITSSLNPNMRFLQDTYTLIKPQNCFASGVVEQAIANATSAPFSQQVIIGDSDIKLNELGLIPCQTATDGVIRSLYTLNIDNLPKIPSGITLKIKGPIVSIMDVIQEVCNKANYDFFIDFRPRDPVTSSTDKTTNQIYVRTLERKSQPPNNYIQQIIGSASSGSVLTSYDYGIELNDSATTRSLYIGAKQKRLLQVQSSILSKRNNGLIYDPYEDNSNGSLINDDINHVINACRIPNHCSVRNSNYGYYNELFNATIGGSGTGSIIWEYVQDWGGTDHCGLGNYLTQLQFVGTGPTTYTATNDHSDIFRDLGYIMYSSGLYLHRSNPNGAISKPDISVEPINTAITSTDNGIRRYYNYPLWEDFICPYFGLDIDGNARKVFYDPGMRQIQVLCSVGDLQNLLGFALTSGVKFADAEISPWTADPGFNKQNNQVEYGMNEARGVAQQVGKTAYQAGGTREQRNYTWNIERRDYYKYNTKFLLTENEIRAAMAGFDSWAEYTFNKTFTTDLGQILRMTIFANSGQVVQERNDDQNATSEIARINMGLDFPLVMVYHGPDMHLINAPASQNPSVSKWGMLTEKVKAVLETAHQYVANIGNTYYGKQFMVKIPGLSYTKDEPVVPTGDLTITKNSKVLSSGAYEGASIYYANYKPSTDGAWEEPGNVIDDTIVVGSLSGDFFRIDDGKISAILGYRASYEYLKDTIPDNEITKYPSPDTAAQNANSAAGQAVTILNNNKETNLTSTPTTNKPGGEAYPALLNSSVNRTPITTSTEQIAKLPPSPAIILSQVSQPASGSDIVPNEWYPSVITELASEEYLFYTYPNDGSTADIFSNITSFIGPVGMTSSTHGRSIPEHLKYKLYAKASIENDFQFINCFTNDSGHNTSVAKARVGGRELRAILTLGNSINLNPVHLVDKYLIHCLTLDSILFKGDKPSIPDEMKLSTNSNITIHKGLSSFSGGFGVGSEHITLSTDHLINSINSSSRTASSDKANTMPIAPRAAMPGFAAVPLESQGSVYGPWTNHPYLLRRDIFTDPDIYNNASALQDAIENLVGGLKVDVDTELAPWKYGGMRALDENVIARIQNDANYQLSIEYGTMDIPGAPTYKLGDFLDKSGQVAGGPIINSISSNIDKGGISTKYSFRTFTKKFGLYNKESADRLAKISSESISRKRQIAVQSARSNNSIVSTLKKQNLNNASSAAYVNPPIAASWRSDSELLVGHNEITFRAQTTGNISKHDAISGILDKFDYDYNWGFHPICLKNPSGGIYNVLDYPKFIGQSKIMDSREIPKTLAGDYETTSMMSLDGILSPISFYPTENFRTYHITKYPRNSCRFCLGVGKIEYSSNQQSIAKIVDIQAITGFSHTGTCGRSAVNIDCPFCEDMTSKAKKLIISGSRGRVTPPYILTSGNDVISTGTGTTVYNTVGTTINYSTLNPVVLSFGEFSVFQNRQEKDFTGHSIKMVAQGSVPPDRANDTLNQQYCPNDRLFKSFLEYDQLYLDKILELRAIPVDKQTDTIANILSRIPNPPRHFENNSRYFGFRGPMMLHGWGYDTDGYPVPNASGDLQYTNSISDSTKRTPIFCALVETIPGGPTGTYVYKNQIFVEAANGSLQAQGKTLVNYNNKEGYWTDPFKESTFAMGWAQTPSTWPVGPIDLRWDERARVWTMPSTYKNVYILLEEDLNINNIARGQIIDNNSAGASGNNSLLPLGYRKTVYVKDTVGVYRAPRSAVIYCEYNTEGGFYQPVSQSIFTTSGTIVSQNSVSVYKIFQSQLRALANTSAAVNEPLTYVASFKNPLGLNVSAGNLVLLTYLYDGWIVQAARG